MKRWMLSLSFVGLISVGVLRAEYDVGDRVLIPLNQYYIVPTRDYPVKVGGDEFVPAVVKYKDDNIYVVVIDSIKYVYTTTIPGGGTVIDSVVIIYDPATIDSNVAIIRNVFNDPDGSGESIKDKVLSYLGLSESDLYDSDNDPRVFIVLTGLYTTSEVPNLIVYSYFDPYFSINDKFPRHELIVLNTNNGTVFQDGYLNPNVLRKLLFHNFSQYALWSVDPDEIDFYLGKEAFYVASQADPSFNYYQGYDDAISLIAPLNPLGITVPYFYGKYLISDMDAEMAYFFFTNVSDYIGDDALIDVFKSPYIFDRALKLALESRGYSLAEVLEDYHLKNLFNETGKFGYSYDNPALSGVQIYRPQVFAVSPTNKSAAYSVAPYGASLIYAKVTSQADRYFVLNYPDSAFNEGLTAYFIDIANDSFYVIDVPDRYDRPSGLARLSQWIYLINTSSYDMPFAIGLDTIPPADYNFNVFTNRFDMTKFYVVTVSPDKLVQDVDKQYLEVSVQSPVGDLAFELMLTEELTVGVGQKRYVYYKEVKFPTLLPGSYIFSIAPRDLVENVGDEKADTLIVEYLSAGNALALSNGVQISGEGYVIANVLDDGVFLHPSGTVMLQFKSSSPSKVVYYREDVKDVWKPLRTYYKDGYVYAYTNSPGIYKIAAGSPEFEEFSLRYSHGNILMNVPAPGIVTLEIFDASGRRVYQYEKRVNMAGTLTVTPDLPNGVYLMKAQYGQTKIAKKVIIVN